ncbi:MAG TPA: MBL fold metallo-hydrolase, partial [Acidimicrobiia bacterium]|nr:MBL fold metallo-hydrolase [Acidimicrobiia bacterium]
MNHWRIGDVTVTRIVEIEVPSNGSFILPEATPENVLREQDWLHPTFADESGKLRMSIHALVIESQGQ